ncbi:hypothetical protein [Parasitella parasitica]|uniref:Phosphorylase kinase alphabeta n=1 Tax=Parasitella parasitica TaxID=35722 RepID=A0A0B7MZS2_9FUNG|nr:hypothetical protein [Parasitella parasitica]
MPASTAITSHGDYTDAWVRDNVYSIYAVYGLALAYKRLDDNTGRAFELQYSVVKLMRGLLFSMMRQSAKVEKFKQTQSLEHALHAKYSTQTGETVVGDFEWGHLQIDATSFFLLALADMTSGGLNIIYSQDEVDFVQNLVFYIERAYRTPDYGIWERGNKINHGQPELNSSSIGMAVAALRAINGVNLFGSRGGPSSVIHVLPDELTRNATTLHSFLPRESNSKEIDGSVLSIIGFPAFAVDDPELIQRTRKEAIKKLEGKYGMKRFLRDGHQTAVEDTSRLYYDANELKVFEDIESEWPLFFTYMVLEGLFTGDLEQAENYRNKLEPLIVDSVTMPSKSNSLFHNSKNHTRSDSIPLNHINDDTDHENDDEEEDASIHIPLLPELYYVPAESIQAEKENPHSQNRVPNENVPLVWALSLYFLGGLITEDLLSPSEIDPLGRRFNSTKMVKDTMIQIVLLSEDQQLQTALSTYGLETQTLDQISATTTVLPPQALVDVYSGLGFNSKMEMTGRPKRPIGVLGTSSFYKIQGQIYAFTPHFMDNNEFYINADPDYLVSEFENELTFTKKNWYYPGRPTMVVLLSHSLLGTTKQSNNILISNSADDSKKNLLNFFTNLRGGCACEGEVRVKLCRLAETINTSNIQSLDFLINKPEVNWKRILRVAHASRTYKKKLGYNESKTQASTPGHRTPGGAGSMSGGRTPKRRNTTFYGKSLASPLDKLHGENYFDELVNALSELKANSEPQQFKLKSHEESKQGAKVESPKSGIFTPASTTNKTGSVPKESADQSSSPHEVLSLTLGDSSQFDQAVESLSASVNLYDQIDLLQYMVSCRPMTYYVEALESTISDLIQEVYLKSKKSKYWSIARQAAGLLHKNVPSLTINITDLVIRQKQVSIGSGPQEYLISMPVAPNTLNKMITEHCTDDVREGPVVQEIIIYLGNLIRTHPDMFEGILRLRTHYIIIALREEISRVNNSDEEESVEHLMQLSPFELESLLFTVLSGPHLCRMNNLVVRDRPGGFLMLSTNRSQFASDKKQESTDNAYIPLLSDLRNSLSIKAQSGGYFSGNFAKVEINGTVMEAISRGIHVWAIDRNQNIILERASFDTHISAEESQAFAQFIHWIADGMVIVIASKDEFIENLNEEAIATLQQLGSTKINRVQYRDSYVFIGEKGDPEHILEAHRSSKDGPTELIEKTFVLEREIESNQTAQITLENIHTFFPNSNGRWLRRRKNDGALNRVPSGNFFPQVWSILNQSKGLCIRNHNLPRDPIVLEKTPEEFNFALAVESFLGWFTNPAERQVAVEVLSIVYQQESKQQNGWYDLPMIISRAIEKFWVKWVNHNKSSIERGGPVFENGYDYQQHVDLARKLFFDLPLDGTESTSAYIKASLFE